MKNLRNVFALVVIRLFSFTSFAQSNVAGNWIVGEKNTVIKIKKDSESHSGKIISSDNPEAKIGRLMVKDLKQGKKGNWAGKVYSPKREEWYDAEFTPKGNILEVKYQLAFSVSPWNGKNNRYETTN